VIETIRRSLQPVVLIEQQAALSRSKEDGMQLTELPTLVTPDQLLAWKEWPIGRSATYEALRRGEIPSVRIGRRILIPRAALEDMLQPKAGIGA
jgi:excisionase family DNA binding protein